METKLSKASVKTFLYYSLGLGTLIICTLIFLYSLFSTNSYATLAGKTEYYALVFAVMAVGLFVLFIIVKQIGRIDEKFFLALICVIAFIIRVTWVLSVDTKPLSDFSHMYDYAVSSANGDFSNIFPFYKLFPFKFGYPMLLALLFKITGASVIAVKLINSVVSVLLVLSVYYAADGFLGKNTARTAAVLCALWPAQIMFCSVVASEHFFLLFISISLAFMAKALKRFGSEPDTGISKRPLLYFTLFGASAGAANFIRPQGILIIVAFFVAVLVFFRGSLKEGILSFLRIKELLLTTVGFILVFGSLSLAVYGVSGIKPWETSTGFNLMVGTNIKYNGSFNTDDYNFAESLGFEPDKVQGMAKDIAIERIKSDPAGFVRLAGIKFNTMWLSESYGFYWSVTEGGPAAKSSALVDKYSRVLVVLSQVWYYILLILVILSSFSALRKKVYILAPLYIFLAGMFVSYIFLEVQSRYHMPAIPIMLVLAYSGGKLRSNKCLSINKNNIL